MDITDGDAKGSGSHLYPRNRCSLLASVLWMIRMENDIEFVWPETGTLKIRNSGESQISLRYMPSLDVIARELGKHRKKASNRSHFERQQNTHRKT